MEKNKGAASFQKTIQTYIDNGWNVTLINPIHRNGSTPLEKGLNHVKFKPIFMPLTKIKRISFLGRILNSLYNELMFYRLGKKVLRNIENKALIYAYEIHGVKAGNKLKSKFNLPFITRFQGTILAPIENNLLNRLKRYPHFEALKTGADLTIMTDDGTQGDLVLKRLNNTSNEVLFWKNGVDIDVNEPINEVLVKKVRGELKLSPNDRVLMTVSRLAKWKKVNRAVEALAEVVKERPEVKLVIVGDGDEKTNLQHLVANLGLNSNVIFTGAIPQVEVKNYLAVSDIFLSLYDLSNVGNPLLEAMSVGKPIITLDVGDTGSLIKHEDSGILLSLDQLDLIPNYIKKILDDGVYANRLSNNAQQYAETNFWTWDERMQSELKAVNRLVYVRD